MMSWPSLILKVLFERHIHHPSLYLGYLESTVLPDLTREDNPFLLGRSLWFAGRFAHAIKSNLLEKFLDATVAGLQPQQNIIVRIQAARAIFEFVVKTSG